MFLAYWQASCELVSSLLCQWQIDGLFKRLSVNPSGESKGASSELYAGHASTSKCSC